MTSRVREFTEPVIAMANFSEAEMRAFDGKAYLRTRFTGQPSVIRANDLRFLHGFYSKYHHTWDAKTARMLEYGGGPAIYALISASPHVKDITFTDIAESNLKEVELWKNNDKDGKGMEL